MNSGNVIYRSASKGDVRLDDMNTPWLLNSWRKVGKEIASASDPREPLVRLIELHVAMSVELQSRGGTYNPDTDRWEFPAKEEAQP